MGACVSSEDKKRSQEIDRGIRQHKKKLREEVKLLLLGKFFHAVLQFTLRHTSISRLRVVYLLFHAPVIMFVLECLEHAFSFVFFYVC